jgi:hypothetical protein
VNLFLAMVACVGEAPDELHGFLQVDGFDGLARVQSVAHLFEDLEHDQDVLMLVLELLCGRYFRPPFVLLEIPG